jgi:hypothetical protein
MSRSDPIANERSWRWVVTEWGSAMRCDARDDRSLTGSKKLPTTVKGPYMYERNLRGRSLKLLGPFLINFI